jgi:CRISPR-associated protein Csx3
MEQKLNEFERAAGEVDGRVDAAALGVEALVRHVERVDDGGERREKLKKGVKVVIGGPPHSGKSVFMNALKDMLDHNMFYAMSANPDGEGTWLQLGYNDEQVRALRKKGQFTPEFVDFASNNVAEWDATPVLLVDVGGVASAENAQIIRGATHAIVLSGTSEKADEHGVLRANKAAFLEMTKWESFFKENGLEVVAKIHSDYHGRGDVSFEGADGGVVGSAHHLERGEDMSNRSTVWKVAEKIREIAEGNEYFEDEKNTLRNLLQDAPKLPDYAFVYDKNDIDSVTKRPRQLFNKETGEPARRYQLAYLPETAKFIHDLSDEEIVGAGEFSGPAPKWVYVALAERAAVAGRPDMPIYSRGFFTPEKLPIAEHGGGAEWSSEVIGEIGGHAVVRLRETSVGQSGKQILADDLAKMSLPDIPEGAIVAFSSQGPNWFDVSVALGYRDKAFAFAEYQPRNRANPEGGEGSVICWARDEGLLGQRVEDLLERQSMHERAERLRNPAQDKLVEFADDIKRRILPLLPEGATVELGGSLVSRTALKGHNDIDLRLLLPLEWSSERAIRELSEKIAGVAPYQKDRPVGSKENQQFAVMHQLDTELPDVEGSVEVELSVRPAEGYVGYARLQADFPEEMLDQYVVYKDATKADKPVYKKVKEQFYAMSRALYAEGYMAEGATEEEKRRLMAEAAEKY